MEDHRSHVGVRQSRRGVPPFGEKILCRCPPPGSKDGESDGAGGSACECGRRRWRSIHRSVPRGTATAERRVKGRALELRAVQRDPRSVVDPRAIAPLRKQFPSAVPASSPGGDRERMTETSGPVTGLTTRPGRDPVPAQGPGGTGIARTGPHDRIRVRIPPCRRQQQAGNRAGFELYTGSRLRHRRHQLIGHVPRSTRRGGVPEVLLDRSVGLERGGVGLEEARDGPLKAGVVGDRYLVGDVVGSVVLPPVPIVRSTDQRPD